MGCCTKGGSNGPMQCVCKEGGCEFNLFGQQDLRQTEDNYLFVISVYTVLFKLFCLCFDRHVCFVKC